MRGDFVTNDQSAGEIVSSMIVTSDTLYTWSVINGESYGMRADRSAMMATDDASQAPDTREPVPLDQDVTYDCTPWTRVDGSIFEPPADVLFQDYSTLMNMGMEFSTSYEGGAESCALCAQLPDATSQAECRTTFACE
jgi:hypothetical protein